MERDPLEQFVEVHRASFDQALPDYDVWRQIEQQLPSDTPGGDATASGIPINELRSCSYCHRFRIRF